MTAIWTYPWTLLSEGVDDACERIQAIGFDSINLASHYHSVRSMQPRLPEAMFRDYPGGCWFDPDPDTFAETPIDPPVNRLDQSADPVADVIDAAADHGLDVAAWTVLTHNSRLGETNPEYQIRTAFGDGHANMLCPSYPGVRDYFAAVVRSVVDRGADEIQIERLGYQSVFHGHGPTFGHDKRMVLTSGTEKALASQCFCDGCAAAASDHPVDLEAAKERVRELLTRSFERPHTDPPALGALLREDPLLVDLFCFRAAVIDQLQARLRAAAGDVPLNYFACDGFVGSSNESAWSAGVRFNDLERRFDRATAICYVASPTEAVDRVRTLRRSLDATVDAGITLNPSVIERESQVHALVDALESATTGRLSVYHHSFLTEAQLDWLDAALGA